MDLSSKIFRLKMLTEIKNAVKNFTKDRDKWQNIMHNGMKPILPE